MCEGRSASTYTACSATTWCVWRPIGSPVFGLTSSRGQFDDVSKAPRPDIVLLDLNLPGTDGREVLEHIKQDESLRLIPVVVLTTSTDDRDVDRCYAAGANSYITKPVDLDGFMRSIQRLTDFWFEVVILPKAGEAKA